MLSGTTTETPSRRLGLRPKFILAFALQTLVSAMLIVGLEQWRVRTVIRDELVADADELSHTVAVAAANAAKTSRVEDLRAITSDLKSRTWIDYADFVTADGKILASQGTAPDSLSLTPGRSQFVTKDGDALHVFVVPVAGDTTLFRLVANERGALSITQQLRWSNLGVVLLALLIAIGLALLSSRFIIRPVLDLADHARSLAEGDLTQRATVQSSDEIGDLAEAFNAMAGNLERTITKLVRSQSQLKSVVENVGMQSRNVAERVSEQRSMIDNNYHSIDQLNNGVRKITDRKSVV